MGIKDTVKDFGILKNRKADVEFSGLPDTVVNVHKELNLHNREGQFYVLLADADIDERVEIERMIDQTGCFITSVSSGIECMDEISRDKYDLILLARNMPRMDGIQTLNNMKNSPMNKSKDAKVYVILGEKVDEPDIFFENAGFDGIIRKPIDRTILQNIIINLVPSKMLPDDEELLAEIKKGAEDAEILKGCGVRLLEALKNFGGDIDAYKEAASKFCDDYEIVSSDMIDALFSGKNTDYMNFSRDMRESSRKIGAAYLADCFDDHVNMSKDDSLDVAESNWHSLVNEWENVVSGLAGWLGKTSIQLGSTEVLTSDTNGIRLSDQDIKNRIEEILINLENNEQELAHKNLNRLFEYELPHDLRHKIDRVSRAFDQDRINTAVDILRSI